MPTPSRRETDEASPEDRVRTERVLAVVRAFLSLAASAAVWLQIRGAGGDAALANPIVGYACLSLLVLLLSQFAPAVSLGAVGHAVHTVDLAFVVTFAVLMPAPSGLSLILFAFVLFSAAARWGPAEVLTTGLLAIVLLMAGMGLGARLLGTGVLTMNSVVPRAGHLLILTLLFAFLARHESAARRERQVVSRVIVGIGRAPSLTAGLKLLFDECASHFAPSAVLLAVEAPRTEQFYLWRESKTDGDEMGLTVEELAPAVGQAYLAPAPRDVTAWYIRRTRGDALRGRGIGSATVAFSHRIDAGFATRYFERHGAAAVLGADSHSADEWRARIVLLNPGRHGKDEVRFLHFLASRVAPAVHHQYVAYRLRSRVSAIERARLARELHDGLIQSLIAVEMELEVLRRRAARAGLPEQRLGHVRDQLRLAIGDVRDLMLQLRPEVETGRDVLRLIAELAGRLRRDMGLDVRLLSTIHDLDCRPRTCRELARLVQEALTNVRKHSGARSVTISLSRGELTNQLVIEDDGRGFGFEGRWSLEQLEASERGPAVIKERVRAMGGTLVIDSQPGRARLEVEWQRSPQ